MQMESADVAYFYFGRGGAISCLAGALMTNETSGATMTLSSFQYWERRWAGGARNCLDKNRGKRCASYSLGLVRNMQLQPPNSKNTEIYQNRDALETNIRLTLRVRLH